MVGSAALVSAMAGDFKKAAQMLDTLAPEVGHAFPTLPAIQLHPTLCLYAHILHKTRPVGHPMPIDASSPLRHYWAHRDSAKLPGTLVEQMSQTIRKEVFVFWRQYKISFCVPELTVPLKCALHLQWFISNLFKRFLWHCAQAQAMRLSTLAPAERTGLLQGMSDEGAAACLAAMSLTARGGVIADLAAADPTLVTCALAFIWCAFGT